MVASIMFGKWATRLPAHGAAALARRSARHVVDATERRFSRFDALRRCPASDAFAASTRAGMCHDARALGPLPGDAEHAVSDVDKFLFDTNGFVVVKDVFSKDDLRAFHDAIDAHAHLIHERKGQLRLTAAKTPLSGDGKTLLFVNLSPTAASANESLCSLRFAKQVNQVELGKATRAVETV